MARAAKSKPRVETTTTTSKTAGGDVTTTQKGGGYATTQRGGDVTTLQKGGGFYSWLAFSCSRHYFFLPESLRWINKSSNAQLSPAVVFCNRRLR